MELLEVLKALIERLFKR